MELVSAFGVVLDLAGFYLRQQIIDVFVIGQRHLNAHAVQALHRGLAHAAANEILAIADMIEFGGVGGIAPHAPSAALPVSMPVLMIVVMVMVMMIVITGVGQLAQLLPGDFAILEGDDQKSFGLAEMPGNGLAIIGGNCDFDCHKRSCEDE